MLLALVSSGMPIVSGLCEVHPYRWVLVNINSSSYSGAVGIHPLFFSVTFRDLEFGCADVFIRAYDAPEGATDFTVDLVLDGYHLRGTFDDLGIAGACLGSQVRRLYESKSAVEDTMIRDTLNSYGSPRGARGTLPAMGKHFQDGLSTSDFLAGLTWRERFRFMRLPAGEGNLFSTWLAWWCWSPRMRKALTGIAAVNMALLLPGTGDMSFVLFGPVTRFVMKLVGEWLLLGYQQFEIPLLLWGGTIVALLLGDLRLESIPLQLLINDLTGVAGPPAFQFVIYALIAEVWRRPTEPQRAHAGLEAIASTFQVGALSLWCFVESMTRQWLTAISVAAMIIVQSFNAAYHAVSHQSFKLSIVACVIMLWLQLGPLTTAAAFRMINFGLFIYRVWARVMERRFGDDWRTFLFWRLLRLVGLARDSPDSIRVAGKQIPLRLAGEDGTSCPICYDSIAGDEMVVEVPCGHIFHGECIRPWFWRNTKCPVCRAQV